MLFDKDWNVFPIFFPKSFSQQLTDYFEDEIQMQNEMGTVEGRTGGHQLVTGIPAVIDPVAGVRLLHAETIVALEFIHVAD